METMFEVLVGNIGYVYRGASESEARKCFDEYIAVSKGYSRARGESVTLLQGNEIIAEYFGTYPTT